MDVYKTYSDECIVTQCKNHSSRDILVIGGCNMHTGAPYFACYSSLRAGAELCYLWTSGCVRGIRRILPEAFVSSKISDSIVKSARSCLLGIGMGDPSEERISEINRVLDLLVKRDIYIVVDGDGIRLLDRFTSLKGYHKLIATPNFHEAPIVESLNIPIAIYKGYEDRILCNGVEVFVKAHKMPKRVGDLGAMLAGMLAGLLSASLATDDTSLLFCMELSSFAVRISSEAAWEKSNLSMMTRDVLELLGEGIRRAHLELK